MSFGACRRETSWFDAAIKGNLQFIERNLQKYKRTYDNRPSKNEVSKGWAAIHYAARLNKADVFQFLFPYEYDLLTDRPTNVQCDSVDSQFTLESGSSIIHILSAVNNLELLQWVVQQWEKDEQYKELVGCKNDYGFSAFLQAPIVDSAAAMYWVSQPTVIKGEVKSSNALNQSIVHIIAYTGSVKYAEFLRDLVAQSGTVELDEQVVSRVRTVLLEFFTQKDKNDDNWIALADKQQTIYPTKTTLEDRKKCKIVLQELYDSLQ